MKKLGLLLTSSLFIGQIYTNDSKFKLSFENSLKREGILKNLSQRRSELRGITTQRLDYLLPERKLLNIKYNLEMMKNSCKTAIAALNLQLMPETQREAARKIKELKRDIQQHQDYLNKLIHMHWHKKSECIYTSSEPKLCEIIEKYYKAIEGIQKNMGKLPK